MQSYVLLFIQRELKNYTKKISKMLKKCCNFSPKSLKMQKVFKKMQNGWDQEDSKVWKESNKKYKLLGGQVTNEPHMCT